MKWTAMVFSMLVLAGMTLPAQAQIFSRKPRLTNVQVPELIVTSRSDPDERRRAAAVEQLREFDAKTHPEIVTTLVDILLGDNKSSVRLEAVNSLSRIRPISQVAGQALETAAHRDDSFRVRIQAKTSLWSYAHAGYRSGSKDTATVAPPATKEPPLANATKIISEPPMSTMPLPGTTAVGPVVTPAAPPTTTPAPGSTRLPQGNPVSIPRPLPSRPDPAFSTAVPQPRRPLPTPSADGPILVPVDR